jgi:hypothetical protein
MKRIIFLIIIFFSLILLFSTVDVVLAVNEISYADDFRVSELANPAPDFKLEIVTLNLEQKIARSGCCSWHGGVCDCIGGRVVCCDRTFSPTCTCNHDSNKEMMD